MLPGKQTCCVGQSAHLYHISPSPTSWFHIPTVAALTFGQQKGCCLHYIPQSMWKPKKVAKTVSISLFLVGSFLAHLQSLSPLAGRWNRLPTAGWGVTCGLTTSIRVSYSVAAPRETGPREGGPRLICAAIYFDIATCKWEIVKNHGGKCLLSQATRYEDFFTKAWWDCQGQIIPWLQPILVLLADVFVLYV